MGTEIKKILLHNYYYMIALGIRCGTKGSAGSCHESLLEYGAQSCLGKSCGLLGKNNATFVFTNKGKSITNW